MNEDRHAAVSRNRTSVERTSDRELRIVRDFDVPSSLVFAAWTTPEMLMRWWAPKSTGMTLVSCDVDARTGGGYRFTFGTGNGDMEPMAFFGRYREVVPNARLVWTNDETDDGAVTTVTFEATGGRTRLVLSEVYPSKEALDEAFVGMEGCMPEQFEQLDDLLAGH